MSGLANTLKKGWHPDKDIDLKKQVTSIWKGDKNTEYEERANRSTRPLASLRDPSSFGPPPRHVALGSGVSTRGTSMTAQHEGAAPVRSPLPSRSTSNAASTSPSPPPYRQSTASRSRYAPQQAEEEDEEPAPQPYRIDTSGLSTSHLPPPPKRRDDTGIAHSPAPPTSGRTARPPAAAPPSLPPRLPPRSSPVTSSSPSTGARNPLPRLPLASSHAGVSPSHTNASDDSGGSGGSYINQAAANRLGQAGISVPGLGIGGPRNSNVHGSTNAITAIGTVASLPERTIPSPGRPTTSQASHPPPSRPWQQPQADSQLNELQARFSKMGTEGKSADEDATVNPAARPGAAHSLVAGKKKPPPPPAKKKPGLGASVGRPPARNGDDGDDAPPPIPMATRPPGW